MRRSINGFWRGSAYCTKVERPFLGGETGQENQQSLSDVLRPYAVCYPDDLIQQRPGKGEAGPGRKAKLHTKGREVPAMDNIGAILPSSLYLPGRECLNRFALAALYQGNSCSAWTNWRRLKGDRRRRNPSRRTLPLVLGKATRMGRGRRVSSRRARSQSPRRNSWKMMTISWYR